MDSSSNPYPEKVVNRTFTCNYGTVYIYEKFKQQYNRIRRDIWTLQHLANGTIADDCIRHKSTAKVPKEGQSIKKQSGSLSSLTNHYGKSEAVKEQDMEILELVLQSEFLTQNRELNKRKRLDFERRMKENRQRLALSSPSLPDIDTSDKENQQFEEAAVDINELPTQAFPLIVDRKGDHLISSPMYNFNPSATGLGLSGTSTLNTPKNTGLYTGSPLKLKSKCQRTLIVEQTDVGERSSTVDMEYFKSLMGTYPQLNQILKEIAKSELQCGDKISEIVTSDSCVDNEEQIEAQRVATNIAAYQAIHLDYQASQAVFPAMSVNVQKDYPKTSVQDPQTLDYQDTQTGLTQTSLNEETENVKSSLEAPHPQILGSEHKLAPTLLNPNTEMMSDVNIITIGDTDLSKHLEPHTQADFNQTDIGEDTGESLKLDLESASVTGQVVTSCRDTDQTTNQILTNVSLNASLNRLDADDALNSDLEGSLVSGELVAPYTDKEKTANEIQSNVPQNATGIGDDTGDPLKSDLEPSLVSGQLVAPWTDTDKTANQIHSNVPQNARGICQDTGDRLNSDLEASSVTGQLVASCTDTDKTANHTRTNLVGITVSVNGQFVEPFTVTDKAAKEIQSNLPHNAILIGTDSCNFSNSDIQDPVKQIRSDPSITQKTDTCGDETQAAVEMLLSLRNDSPPLKSNKRKLEQIL